MAGHEILALVVEVRVLSRQLAEMVGEQPQAEKERKCSQNGLLVQMARTLDLHSRGREFESRTVHNKLKNVTINLTSLLKQKLV